MIDPYSLDPGFAPAPVRRNNLWESWGPAGIGIGSLLLLLGLAMIPIEVSRIIKGSLNRNRGNDYVLYPNYNRDLNGANTQIQSFIPDVIAGNTNNLAQKGIIPYSAIGGNGNTGFNNFPIQDKYLWPWSHAALLFSLITIAAGIVGIVSGCRRSYSSIFAFFALSLLSAFMAIFLVVYYAVHVYYQLNQNATNRNAFGPHNLDYALGATMLALSAATLFFSLISTFLSCFGAGVCLGRKALFPKAPFPDPYAFGYGIPYQGPF